MKLWTLSSICLAALFALPMESHALLSRHNEQGLSPTHSYKRTGASGVVSNLNGNLVVNSTPVSFPGAGLGVSLSRTWNSHWRDPLLSYQYDMDYNAIDVTDQSKQRPTYRDQEVTSDIMDIGGFATRRIHKIGSPAEIPQMWGFAQSVSLSLVQVAAAEAIRQAINQHYSEQLTEMNARRGFLKDDYVKTPDDKALEGQIQSDNRAAMQVLSTAVYLATNAKDDYRILSSCAESATGQIQSASGDCTQALFSVAEGVGGAYIPYLADANMVYKVAKGKADAEDVAWFIGQELGQMIVSNIVGGGLAGGAAGVAVAAAIELTKVYIALNKEWAKTYDIGYVTLNPWAMGVNGYVGMIGTNHDPELQRAQARFQRRWTTTTVNSYTDDNNVTTNDTTYPVSTVSRHPMPELHLVGSDGGASRFVLSDDTARTVTGRRWVSYVSLSNADRRKVYFCLPRGTDDNQDLGLDPDASVVSASEQADTSGYYLVKDPSGTQVVFGVGGPDKGISFDQAGFQTYWAVPSRYRSPTGDSVLVQRDGSHHVASVRDARTGQGSLVSDTKIISGVIDDQNRLVRGIDTIWQSAANHEYLGYHGKGGDVSWNTSVLAWEARRVNATQIDTTRFGYSSGDLVSIDDPNGSREKYAYAGERFTTLDGFVASATSYPDRDDETFYLRHLYTYLGWGDSKPTGLKTSIQTILRQPDHVVNPDRPWRESQTADWYNFAPMMESQNINRKMAGYFGRTTVQRVDGTIHDTDKVLDSMEYKTSRFQLIAEYHGAGSSDQLRTQYVYNGDQQVAKIESRGLSGSYDPRITRWDYDNDGSIVRETVCPKQMSDSLQARLSRLPGAPPANFSCPEVITNFGVRHRESGEYWLSRIDTSIVKDQTLGTQRVLVTTATPNPTFYTDSLYRLGLKTSSRTWRRGAARPDGTIVATDSVMIADSTEYQDWKASANATPFVRAVRQRAKVGNAWPITQDVSYADPQNRPALPYRVFTYLSPDSVTVSEVTYDSVNQIYPTRQRAYVRTQAVGGAAPTGVSLDDAKFYDVDHGWMLAKKDPAGRVTKYQYDRSGRTLSVTYPDGGISQSSYVDRLQPTSAWRNVQGYASNYPNQKTVAVRETDPSGVTVEARFDGLGRLVAEKRMARGANMATTDTSIQHTTLVSYNIFNKLQWKRDPDGREEFNDYSGTGRLASNRIFTQPAVASLRSLSWENRYYWDDIARTLIEEDQLGTRTTFHWDGLGRDTLIERDSGSFSLRVAGEASAGVKAPVAMGTIKVRQSYDNVGNLIKIIDPKGLVETYTFDDRNRQSATKYPDDLRHAIGYDLAGRVVVDTVQGVAHPESLTVKSMAYDGLSRPLSEKFGPNARENVTMAWDAYGASTDPGRLLAVTRGTGVVASYVYDPMGRRTSRVVVLPSFLSTSQSWTYDVAGAVTRWDLPGAAHGTSKFDAFHRLSSESLVHGTDSIPALHDLRYRQNDLLDGYGLGTRLKASFAYEPQRALLKQSMVTKAPANDTMYLQRMTWDGAGNVAGMRRNLGDSLGFDVDHLYQLNNIRYPDGQAIQTTFDPNGNRTRLSHSMGRGTTDTFTYAANRVTTGYTARKGWTTFKHDSRGNLAVEASFASVGDTGNLAKAWRIIERRFNMRSELERVRVISRLEKTDTTWLRFDYGEDGNRILSAVGKGGDTSTWTTTHKWIYEGSVIAADSGSDHGWTWHLYNGLNRVAEATDSAGRARVRYVLTDHQGTTQALLGDTGAVLGHWIWDPWGNIEESWTQRTTELLYQGKPYETALGEWAFNARWYSPERGSFTGRDAAKGGMSPYIYSNNSPSQFVDRDGKYPDPVSFFWGQALAWNNMIRTEVYLNDQGASYLQVAGGGLGAYLTTTAMSVVLSPAVSGGLLNTSLAFGGLGVVSGAASATESQLAYHGTSVSDWSGQAIAEGAAKSGEFGLAIGVGASCIYWLGGTELSAGLGAAAIEGSLNWMTDGNPLGKPSFTPDLVVPNQTNNLHLDSPQSGMAKHGFTTEITP